MKLVYERVIPAKTGHAVEVKQGQVLRLIDLEGKQVVDMAVFNLHNLNERLSPSYSRTRRKPRAEQVDHKEHVSLDRLQVGDYLRSTIARPLMQIVTETAEPKGVHDTYIRMCNRMLYENFGLPPQDGCMETVGKLVEPYGIPIENLPDPLNVFMNMPHNCAEGKWDIREPVTKPGDYIEFKAEMDVLVALSACPEDQLTVCNGGKATAVKVELYSA